MCMHGCVSNHVPVIQATRIPFYSGRSDYFNKVKVINMGQGHERTEFPHRNSQTHVVTAPSTSHWSPHHDRLHVLPQNHDRKGLNCWEQHFHIALQSLVGISRCGGIQGCIHWYAGYEVEQLWNTALTYITSEYNKSMSGSQSLLTTGLQ